MADGMVSRRRHSEPAILWKKLRQRTVEERVRLVRGKYLCLVTGAGNGLGRALGGLAFQDQGIFPKAMSGSKVVLIDVNEEDLKETSGKKMRQFLKHRKIDVELITCDLSNLKQTKAMMDRIEASYEKDFEHVILINHATSIGDVSKQLSEIDDIETVEGFMDLNITSRMYLTTRFGKIFKYSKQTVVHTFRFGMEHASPYFGLSYMAQNAIKAFGETFAKENPRVRVVHFTPTNMFTNKTQIILETCGNDDIKSKLRSQVDAGTLQQPLEAAKRLTKALDDEFQPGYPMNIAEQIHDN